MADAVSTEHRARCTGGMSSSACASASSMRMPSSIMTLAALRAARSVRAGHSPGERSRGGRHVWQQRRVQRAGGPKSGTLTGHSPGTQLVAC